MNKKRLLITPVLLSILLVLILTGCGSTAQEAANEVQVGQQPQGFWVSGTGKITVTPDLATISLGIQSMEKNVADARTKAADGMDNLMQSLKDSGIAEKDVQTGYFNIDQKTQYNNYSQTYTILGYEVTNYVTVKVRNIDSVGDVIDAAVQAGGDLVRINNLYFSVEDPSKYYTEVREKAVADAADKAEQYAKLMNAGLGNPTFVTEGTLASDSYDRYQGYYSMGLDIVESTLSSGTSIRTGENTITLNVTVSYKLIE
jgi:uncharacterized protein